MQMNQVQVKKIEHKLNYRKALSNTYIYVLKSPHERFKTMSVKKFG